MTSSMAARYSSCVIFPSPRFPYNTAPGHRRTAPPDGGPRGPQFKAPEMAGSRIRPSDQPAPHTRLSLTLHSYPFFTDPVMTECRDPGFCTPSPKHLAPGITSSSDSFSAIRRGMGRSRAYTAPRRLFGAFRAFFVHGENARPGAGRAACSRQYWRRPAFRPGQGRPRQSAQAFPSAVSARRPGSYVQIE